MYTKYWELNAKPFEIGCDPRFYYASETYQSVLLKLRYTIENRHGSALLRGPVGVGKSMLVEMLKEYQKTSAELGPFVTLVMPQLNADEILCYLAETLEHRSCPPRRMRADAFQTRPRTNAESGRQPVLYNALSTVETFLERNAQERRHTVFVIEDAHQITDPQVYSLFKSLLGFQHGGRPMLSLLLVAASSSFTEEPKLSFIDDCIETVAELAPLSSDDTTAYINYRLEKAGRVKPIFSPEALETIYYLTSGNPRKINRLCDLALLIGYAENLTELNSDILESLNNELIAIN